MPKQPATFTRIRAAGRGPRILVLGLGNLLLADDGAGVHAVRRLREGGLRGVLAVDVGVAVLDALHLIERADRLLAFEALRAGGAPGTVYALGVEGVRDEGVRYSAHELSLLGALRLARRRPDEIVILAVEPARIDFGDHLSDAVERALPGLLEAAQRLIAHWKRDPASRGVAEAVGCIIANGQEARVEMLVETE